MIKKIIKNFKTKWMVWHSSKFLIKKMIWNIDVSKDLVIVQYWSWKAVFVKQILKKMSKNSKLYVFEIDERCNKYVEEINDSRLIYINDSAEKVFDYVSEKKVDVVVSTLPFWSLPKDLLKYFLTDKKAIENIFWIKSKISFELINFPPAFIYKIQK